MKAHILFLALATALCGQPIHQKVDLYSPPIPMPTEYFIQGGTHAVKSLATVTQASAIEIHTDKGNIRVDCKTGEVELPKDMTITVASFEFWKAIEKAFPQHFNRSPNGPHVHDWGKWTAPEISSDWYNGTRSYQHRVCAGCGLAEARVTQVFHSTK